ATISEGTGRFSDAVLDVVRELIVGVEARSRKEDDTTKWSLVDQARTWKPSVTADPDAARSPQRPRFAMATSQARSVGRARLWMRREGTAFNSYVTEDLRSFFDESELTPDVFGRRREKFREQLQAALGASEPLVKLNPTLLRLVHDKSVNEATSLVFS